MKTGLKFESGKIVATLADGIDADKDGVMAAEAEIGIKIDLAEAINEAFKTDASWLKGIIETLGVMKG